MSDPVPRETPPTPPTASGVFPVDRVHLAEQYAATLADAGVVRGLIGPREAPRLWERHLLNCAVLAEAVPHGATVADLGSGAGLPGLVVAIARPDLAVTLVEPLLRRTTFLHEVVTALGLDTVEVVRDRSENLHGRRTFDVVTSRALAPLDRLLHWSLPLVRRDGLLLAMKGRSVRDELAAAADTLSALGGRSPEVLQLGVGILSDPVTVLRVEAGVAARIPSAPQRRGGSQGRDASTNARPRRKGQGRDGHQRERDGERDGGRRGER